MPWWHDTFVLWPLPASCAAAPRPGDAVYKHTSPFMPGAAPMRAQLNPVGPINPGRTSRRWSFAEHSRSVLHSPAVATRFMRRHAAAALGERPAAVFLIPAEEAHLNAGAGVLSVRVEDVHREEFHEAECGAFADGGNRRRRNLVSAPLTTISP